MTKVILLDDEINCIEVLMYELKRIEEPIEIVATFTDPSDALNKIPNLTFDILFLDIEMPEMNAFQFLDKLGPISAKIVFTTAYDQFALKAFRYYAIDYLLKPIASDELNDAVTRIHDSSMPIQQDVLKDIYTQITNKETEFKKIALPVNDGFKMVNISEIVYCQADSNYSKIHLKSNNTLVISKPLKYLHELLISHGYYRIHQSILINLNFLTKYSRTDGGFVELEGGIKLAVSRANKKAFENFISTR